MHRVANQGHGLVDIVIRSAESKAETDRSIGFVTAQTNRPQISCPAVQITTRRCSAATVPPDRAIAW